MALAFSPQGDVFATGGSDQRIKLWDARTYERKHTFATCPDWIFDIVFSPDGKRIASTGKDGMVRVWHPVVGEALL